MCFDFVGKQTRWKWCETRNDRCDKIDTHASKDARHWCVHSIKTFKLFPSFGNLFDSSKESVFSSVNMKQWFQQQKANQSAQQLSKCWAHSTQLIQSASALAGEKRMGLRLLYTLCNVFMCKSKANIRDYKRSCDISANAPKWYLIRDYGILLLLFQRLFTFFLLYVQ